MLILSQGLQVYCKEIFINMSYVKYKVIYENTYGAEKKKKKHNKKGIFPLGFYVLMRTLVQLKTSHLSIPFLL